MQRHGCGWGASEADAAAWQACFAPVFGGLHYLHGNETLVAAKASAPDHASGDADMLVCIYTRRPSWSVPWEFSRLSVAWPLVMIAA